MDSHREELLERVKKDVRSVLITESGGMLLENFMKIFRQLTNSTIPYRRLGYKTVEELLLEVTDVCRCQRLPSGQLHLRPVCDKSTSHVLKMVERSRRPRSGASCRAKVACQQRGQHVPWLPGILLDEERTVTEMAVATAPRCAGSVPVAVRDSVLKLLASHPQGIHIDEFNQKHKLMFGHAITFIGFGFYSMKGMLESVPQLVRLKETPIGIKAFPLPALGSRRCPDENRPSGSGPPGDLPPADAFLSYEDSVYEFSDRLLKVLSAQKTAVRVSDILNLHLRQFGHTLDYQEYGFTSLLGALASLGPPFHLEKRADDWHVRVTRGGGLPAAADRGGTPYPATRNCTDVHSAEEDALPVEDGPPALPCLPDIGPARFAMQSLSWLEDGRQVTTETGYPLLEVVITHVQSPGEFFFCLSGSACELPRLEVALVAVYGGAAGCLLPADHQLTVGRPLAAHTSAGWRRALLLGRVAEYVKVCLVDTGATLLLPLESVRVLHNQFMELPVIAHQGTLARVAPLHGDSTWSRQALRLFNGLVGGDVPLMATVLLQSQFTSSVLLCDTRGEADIHVGDQLVSAGQASVRQDDSPPTPLGTPDSRLLHDVYQLLDGQQRRLRPDRTVKPDCITPVGQTAGEQDRVPPEGAEPLSPTSRPQLGASQMESRHVDDQITSLKAQCYDTQKQISVAPVGPRRAALHARLRRLETQLGRLLVGQYPPTAGP